MALIKQLIKKFTLSKLYFKNNVTLSVFALLLCVLFLNDLVFQRMIQLELMIQFRCESVFDLMNDSVTHPLRCFSPPIGVSM